MKSKYTPGPWTVERSPFGVYNVDHGILEYHVVSGDIMIAALYCDPDSEYANLIAAAPELLEALEAVKAYDYFDGSLPPGVKNIVYSAIAKAKGETND